MKQLKSIFNNQVALKNSTAVLASMDKLANTVCFILSSKLKKHKNY